jgi:flagellar biosynthesis GTPase FlhF
MYVYPPASLTSTQVVRRIKEKGLLVKYFTTLSRDNGGLLLNCTWLDPWVTAKMLRLLFALAIKIIVAGALALEAAAAAQSMLRQSQEEAEVQDAVEDEQEKRDVERAAQRKEKNRIPKKMKKVLTEEEEKEAHAIRHQKDEQKRDRQEQKARKKRDRQEQKTRLKAEKAQKVEQAQKAA